MQISGISSLETGTASQSPDGQSPERFILGGKSRAFDRRISAVRRDLVDIRFAGQVFAPHYSAGMAMTATRAVPVRSTQNEDSAVVSYLLAGETFEALEIAEHRAWGVCTVDGSVGYIDSTALAPLSLATHIVGVREAAEGSLGMGDCVVLEEASAAPADLLPLKSLSGDPASFAELLAGAPFLAGGRSGRGVDAGGLIFLVHRMCGVSLPRFVDLQREAGSGIAEGEALRRGDIVLFEDHAAVMIDPDSAIHAVPEQGVVRQPLKKIITGAAFGPVVAYRRIG